MEGEKCGQNSEMLYNEGFSWKMKNVLNQEESSFIIIIAVDMHMQMIYHRQF